MRRKGGRGWGGSGTGEVGREEESTAGTEPWDHGAEVEEVLRFSDA